MNNYRDNMASKNSPSSKQLAKNTLTLYIRTIITLLITLFTSRVILRNLGVADYGIYNVIGGIVSLFGIISHSLTTSISRNLTFELGKGNKDRLNKFFSMSINIQLLLIIVIYIIGETIGVWFLNSRMVIPEERMIAANLVYQFSLATFAFNLIAAPYNASLIAHERMSTFAYIGVLDVVLKLGISYLICVSPLDRLIAFAFLLFIESVMIRSIYQIYCKRNFEECTYHFTSDKAIFKDMFGFATWNFIGATSSIFRSQGVNIILNLFFGPAVNAARGIANQVNGAVNTFVGNFMTALTPQITKSYAQGNYTYLLQCIYRGSKYSFFLLYFLSLPVLIETDYILGLWLVNVPETTVWFVRLILLFSLVDTYSRALINANNATGDIKIYQLVIGGLNLTVLPIAYIILKMGASAESTVLVSVIVSLLGLFPRIYFNKKHFPITYKNFTIKVILPTVLVSATGGILPFIAYCILPATFSSFLIVTFLCIVSTTFSIWGFGCNKEEKYYVIKLINNKVLKQ